MVPTTLRGRLSRGETIDSALLRPTEHQGRKPEVMVPFNGQLLPIRQVALALGVKANTLRKRLRREGWTAEMAVQRPMPSPSNPRGGQTFDFRGRTMSLHKWAQELGVSRSLLRNRLAMGWTFEKAATEPKRR
jgi:hypothetical protein